MANNVINTKNSIMFNSIPDQQLLHANQLTLESWNNIINMLRTQANANANYLQTLHTWMLGNADDEYIIDDAFVKYTLDAIRNLKTELSKKENIGSIKEGIVGENQLNTELRNKIDSGVINSIEADDSSRERRVTITYNGNKTCEFSIPAGVSINIDKRIPSSGSGLNGDIFINSSTGEMYLKSNDKWESKGTLQGPQGEQGPQGDPGIQGPPGPTGPQGTGVSIKGTAYKGTANADTDGTLVDKDGNIIKGNEGDSYIVDDDIDALYVYIKEENGQSIWHCVGAIQGPRGYSPEIKKDGYWYINEVCTDVKAEGIGIKSIKRNLNYSSDNQYEYILTYTDGKTFTYYVENGIDGITPRVRIRNKKWEVSYDEGSTWEKLNQVAQGITPQVRIDKNEWEVSYDEGSTWEKLNQVAQGPQGFTPSFKVEGDILYANTEQAPSIFNQNVGNVKGTGIADITGPAVDGTKRTYTILLTDKRSYPITVYDGANASNIEYDNLSNTFKSQFDAKYDNIDDIIYTNKKPVPVAIGGINAGDTFENISINELINKLLYPYVAPTLSSSNTNLTANTFKYGVSQEITNVVVKIKKGTNNIKNIKLLFNSNEIGNSSEFIESNGIITCNFSNISYIFNTDGTLKITIIEENDKKINVNLQSYKFVYPSYVGKSTKALSELTADDITSSLSEIVSSKITSYTYELTRERAVIAYPADYGRISQIKDSNGFDVTNTFAYKNFIINGISYHAYGNDPSTVESITYKFSYGG